MCHNEAYRINGQHTSTVQTVGYEPLQSSLIHLKIIVVATILVATVLGCVQVYKVEFQNNLPVSLIIVAKQYHATGFGGVRDREFPDANLVRSDQFKVLSGAKIVREFNDASGGFWVLWSAVSAEDSAIKCSGEISLTEGPSPFIVILDEKTCLAIPK